MLLDNLLQAQMLAEDAVDVHAALAAWTIDAEVYKGKHLRLQASRLLDRL